MSLICSPTHATASPASDAPCVQPVNGVTNMLTGTINTRNHIHIACWNVRTLLDIGSQCITARTLHDYHIDIACLSEVRLPNSGVKHIKAPGVNAGYYLYHSGPTDNSGLYGVAFAVNGKANNALLAWEPISSRIALIRFRGTPLNISVIAVYAPTMAAEATVKNEFYDELQEVVNRVSKQDILLVAGDWNARTGPSNQYTRHILGKFGLGQRCENGERLVSFADHNKLVVSNTRFQHPKKHLLTWYSNDGRTAHQIDYILVRSRWASSIEDCRSYRGAETGNKCGTDHTLVRARFKIHLTTRRKTCAPKRINVAALDLLTKRQALSGAITSRLAGNPIEGQSVNQQWNSVKTSVQQAALTELGTTQRRQKDWITETTLQLSTKAREARLQGSPNFRYLRRQATRSARNDRNKYWSELTENMETATNTGDFGKLFRIIRFASGKRQPSEFLLRDTAGQLIPEKGGKLQRWVEHFDQLLNRSSGQYSDQIPLTQCDVYNISCDPPSRLDITNAIQKLKNKKAPGEDGIPPEIYKACLLALVDPLYTLFCSIWESEVFPSDWSTSILLPLPKKGDKTVCDNYRGISLIDVAAKVFSVLLLNRFNSTRDVCTRPNQGGFRRGRGCVDQIFTLRRILEHRYKFQQPTIACFIDFRAAFDSVNRDSLWAVLKADGMPDKLVNLLKSYYSSTRARVRVYGEESDDFSLNAGVRQGCPLSPVLFNYMVDWIMQQALADYRGVELSPDLSVADLEFADDIVILGDTPIALQPVLHRINFFANAVGMEINTSKTKIFSTCPAHHTHPIYVNGEQVEYVAAFKYLGSTILPNGQAKDEVRLRVDNARMAFHQLRTTLWSRSEISLRTKLRVFRVAIRPILTYGCETWPLRVEDVRKLEVFDHWCLRRIIKADWRDQLSNDEIRRRCLDTEKLSVFLQRRRLQWFGHVLRRPTTELSNLCLSPLPCPGWRCRLGGQLKTWISTIKSDVESLGLQSVYGVRRWNQNWVRICFDLASDRRSWAAAIRDIHEAGSSSSRR